MHSTLYVFLEENVTLPLQSPLEKQNKTCKYLMRTISSLHV